MDYKEGFKDGLSHAAEIIWPTGNTTNVETMTLIKASGIIRKEMLSEALAGFKPDVKRFRTSFEMIESFSDYLDKIDDCVSEITEIPKCNCDSHNNRVCDVCQIYIPEIDRLKTERDRYHKALIEISDFAYDEPDSVRIAREALQGQEVESE